MHRFLYALHMHCISFWYAMHYFTQILYDFRLFAWKMIGFAVKYSAFLVIGSVHIFFC